MTTPEWISLADAAHTFGRTPGAFRAAARRGRLEVVRVGREYITTRDAAADYVASITTGRPHGRPDGAAVAEATP